MKPQVIALLLAGATSAAWGQSADSNLAPPPPAKEEKTDKPEKPDKGEKPGNDSKPEKNRNERPERPGRPDISESKPDGGTVEDIKSDFRSKADDILKRHKQLLQDLKDSKGQDKKRIREEIKELKEQWKSDQLDTARELLADHKDKIDKEKDKGKGGGGGGGRPRD